jgi:methionine synthase I (cobalamin-dependent)
MAHTIAEYPQTVYTIAGAMLSKIRNPASRALDRLFSGGRALCDGAMGTMLYGHGCSIHSSCDEANLSHPHSVASIHLAYLKVGAQIIETNTFGGNALRLEQFGLRDKVREINLAGVRIARQCIAQSIIAQTGASESFIAGAVGPLGIRLGLDDARAAFAEQIRALTEGGAGVGVDLLMIETMTSLAEAGEAIRAAHEVAPGMRLVVMMTVGEHGNCLDGASPETAASRLTELGADAVGCNCSIGPASVLRAVERMRTATDLPLAAMPNVGSPSLVDGRHVYTDTPEAVAEFVPRFLRAGVSLMGGCCGTTPEHTRAMGSAMQRP